MDEFIFPERELRGIDFQGPLLYARPMSRETKAGTAEESWMMERENPACRNEPFIRDAAWEQEKKWFEENRSLDPLALFAKHFARL